MSPLCVPTASSPDHALTHSLLAESLYYLSYKTAGFSLRLIGHSNSPIACLRENQLLIEARYRKLSNDYVAALDVYRSLWNFFPRSTWSMSSAHSIQVSAECRSSEGSRTHRPATAAGSWNLRDGSKD